MERVAGENLTPPATRLVAVCPTRERAEEARRRMAPAILANHRGDRHVLAAAVRGRADVIVTENLRHFAAYAPDPYSVEAQAPDEFLS